MPQEIEQLNGDDGLGLSYEREVRADGTVEDKHYLNAGGVVFALANRRTTGQTVTHNTSYFHHDHLGSIATITDETGTVVERLAFDPWGKRRFIATPNLPDAKPGWPDTKDEIVGLRTDRGYTMHEELDEVGAVHMNGRLYGPLIGRSMTADSVVPNPSALQSFASDGNSCGWQTGPPVLP